MTEEIPVFDIYNLPKGVLYTSDPMKMADLRMRPGVQLVMAPFCFSSGARKAINAMSLSDEMHRTKAERDEGDRFRPDYTDVGPLQHPRAVAMAQINRSFSIPYNEKALVDDTARAVRIFQNIFGDNTVGMRIEAHGVGFRGFNHFDTSRAGATIQYNGTTMTVRVRDHSQRRSPLKRYRIPRNIIATWWGQKGDHPDNPPLDHMHGEVNVEEFRRANHPVGEKAWRALLSVLQS